MKALSLTQPWATAIFLGRKQWETRSWSTNYRGPICIHAAKGFPKWAKEFALEEDLSLDELPLGAIICVCKLITCLPTEVVTKDISKAEQGWGDYSPGRYAFRLDDIEWLAEPVPARGMLGIWTVPTEIAVQVTRQVREAGKY